MGTDIIILLLVLAINIGISFLTNWLMLRFSANFGTKNTDSNQVRWASSVKPSVGGFSFLIAFLISVSATGFIIEDRSALLNKQYLGILGASLLGFLIGLADDTYNTNPLVKFIGQLCCAFILISTDVYIHVFDIPALDFLISIIWVIGLMNSVNMLDNMDAITASVSAVIILGMLCILLLAAVPNSASSILLMGTLGGILGFLYFNWNPSKMYMGDTGSQFLGVFLAATSMQIIWNFKDSEGPVFQFKQFVVPMLLFIVPLTDTITVTFRRLLRKQSPFVGGKDHTTHHFAYLGFSDRKVALLLILFSFIGFAIALFVIQNYNDWTQSITLLCYIFFILFILLIQVAYNKGLQMKNSKSSS